jgi:hypothetical protein
MWGCILIPNRSSETKTSQGKANYTIVSTTFHIVLIFVEYQYIVLYKKGKGRVDFRKGGRDKPRCF